LSFGDDICRLSFFADQNFVLLQVLIEAARLNTLIFDFEESGIESWRKF